MINISDDAYQKKMTIGNNNGVLFEISDLPHCNPHYSTLKGVEIFICDGLSVFHITKWNAELDT